jgi:hypothetical protein
MLLADRHGAWRGGGEYYEGTAPNTFRSVLASNLLQGAVITIGAAVIATLLGLIQEMRAKRERDATKRLELFRRMRTAHVRIASTQRLLKADSNPKTYGKQMRALMVVARDLEEVREEVRVSGHLYKEHDRRSIMEGIAMIIEFLEEGSSEYIQWCNRGPGLRGRPRGIRWVADRHCCVVPSLCASGHDHSNVRAGQMVIARSSKAMRSRWQPGTSVAIS